MRIDTAGGVITGLVWERTATGGPATWVVARVVCLGKTVGGRKAWRLPSVHELADLIDATQSIPTLPPAILSVLTYLAKHASRKKSKANDLAILNHHLGYLRPRKLSTITREDIAKLHTKIGTEPSSVIRPGQTVQRPMPRQANSVLALMRSMFNLATDWGLYSGANPCIRIKKFPEVSRDRFVKPDELPRLWKALQGEKSPYIRGAFFVSLLTGARRDEVLTMKWTDLDLQQGI